jgi:hypothetical protein
LATKIFVKWFVSKRCIPHRCDRLCVIDAMGEKKAEQAKTNKSIRDFKCQGK